MITMDVFERLLCIFIAALGFAIYFNTPKRALVATGLLALMGGLMKLMLLHQGAGDILATLGGASIIGVLAIQVAHYAHVPQIVLSIPALIPFVPGSSTYQMMRGLLSLTRLMPNEAYLQILSETVRHGISAAFITMAIAVGVGIPMLITRKTSGKHLYFNRWFKR